MSYSVLIYANCQGEEIQATFRHMPCMAGRLEFKWIPLHLLNDSDWALKYTRAFLSDVVMVWEQVETGDPSPHRAALYARLPKNTPVLTFPPLGIACLWPFSGNDPRQTLDPDRYPWPDSIAAVLATENLPGDELFAKYLAETTRRMPDLDRRVRLDVNRWKALDAVADVKLADWVEQNFRSTQLFHAAGHITGPAVAHLVSQLVRQTPVLTPALIRTALGEIDGLLRDHTGQDFESVPVHPLVAERLGLEWFDPDARYRWHAHEWTFRQYILHYIKWQDYLM